MYTVQVGSAWGETGEEIAGWGARGRAAAEAEAAAKAAKKRSASWGGMPRLMAERLSMIVDTVRVSRRRDDILDKVLDLKQRN